MIQYIISGIIILLFIIVLIYIIKLYKQRIKYKEEYLEKRKKELDAAFSEEQQALTEVQRSRRDAEKHYDELRQKNEQHLQEQEEVAKKYLASLEEQKQAREKSNAELEEQQKLALDEKLELYYGSTFTEYVRSLREAENQMRESIESDMNELYNQYTTELLDLKTTIDEYQAKQKTINEQILRQRAIDEQQDFYRICITDDDINDIVYLTSILSNIHHKETLNKLIWSEYLQQPFKKMLNNVLGNSDPKNVIYKITNIDTKEIYIGKTSGSVSNRWTEHIKTSLNIGTIKSAPIHKALYKNWSRFTFEVLEKVPQDDNLGEHEKYWINFYQSTVYGYNVKSGG